MEVDSLRNNPKNNERDIKLKTNILKYGYGKLKQRETIENI